MPLQPNSQKHKFAVYVPHLAQLLSGKTRGQAIIVNDTDLYHRIINVLRLGIEDILIIFDQTIHVDVKIQNLIKKKAIHFVIEKIHQNNSHKPFISFWLPLLKKEALEATLYSLVEVGVSQIQLITTQKSQTLHAKDYERAQKILIAAGEQSKNFAFPDLLLPIDFSTAVQSLKPKSKRLFFDPNGLPFFEFLQAQKSSNDTFILAVGPEGDLTHSEKELLKESEFTFCALTPTILRASSAASLSAGMIRSLFR